MPLPSVSWTASVTDTPLPVLGTPDQADAYQLPTLVDGQINIREVNGFSDEYNTWYIYGLISNDTTQTVNDIVIEIQLLDTNGGVLYTDTTNPAIHTLALGKPHHSPCIPMKRLPVYIRLRHSS